MNIACVDKRTGGQVQGRRTSDVTQNNRDRRARLAHSGASAESVLLARFQATSGAETDRAAAYAAQAAKAAAERDAKLEAAKKAWAAQQKRTAEAKEAAAKVAFVFERRRRAHQRAQAVEDAVIL